MQSKSLFFFIVLVILFVSVIVSICFHQSILALTLYALLLLISVYAFVKFKKSHKLLFKQSKSQDKYIQAFENTGIYAKLDANYKIIKTNRNFCQVMHMVKHECESIDLFEFIDEHTEEIKETLKYNQIWDGLLILKTSDKTPLHLNCSFTPILDEEGNFSECIFLATDITDLIVSKSNIKKHLYSDALTKLPNRLKLFTERKSFQKEFDTTYIIFNIDSFESINTLYGHDFGDEILLKVSNWLKLNLPALPEVTLYKFEADIFTAVISSKFSYAELNLYLKHLTEKLSSALFTCNGVEIDITMTIGASQAKTNQLKLAQIAYKEAKLAKKAFCIYDKSSNKEQEYNKNIETLKCLKMALQNQRVIPYFQPIVDMRSKKIQKYESLMRIIKEDGSIMSPIEFLEIAKNSKIYHELSQMLIQKTFDAFQNSGCSFSINLSFLDITDKHTREFILDTLEQSGSGPWVVFELLESEGIENYESIINFIEQVKAYGCKIAIDDFGSGYSNFERLLELKVDYIKIDGSLIKNIDTNEDMRIITKTIVNFAKELGIKTIAEYVHSEDILKIIKALDIDYAQGYHLGKPSKNLL